MVNKINYSKIFEKILEENNKKFKDRKANILLHSCCGPCSSYVLSVLADFFNIFVFYYNPNIFPVEEYTKRKGEKLRLLSFFNFKNIKYIESTYNHEYFLESIKGHENDVEGGSRCDICFKLRLEEAVKLAKKLNLDYFSTTLTVSPHKNAQNINNIGKNLSEKYSVDYLFSDFKKKDGYKKSIELSKKYNLYRQNYCGCEFSLKNNCILNKKD